MCHHAAAGAAPDAEHEHHAAMLRESVGAVEDLLRAAEATGDSVGGRDAGDAECGVLDHLSILDVGAADLFWCPVVVLSLVGNCVTTVNSREVSTVMLGP